jgi:hypothetical protein
VNARSGIAAKDADVTTVVDCFGYLRGARDGRRARAIVAHALAPPRANADADDGVVVVRRTARPAPIATIERVVIVGCEKSGVSH